MNPRSARRYRLLAALALALAGTSCRLPEPVTRPASPSERPRDTAAARASGSDLLLPSIESDPAAPLSTPPPSRTQPAARKPVDVAHAESQLQNCLWLVRELARTGTALDQLDPAALPALARWLGEAEALRALTESWRAALASGVPLVAVPAVAEATDSADADTGLATAEFRPSGLQASIRRVRREIRIAANHPEQLADLRETLRHLEAVRAGETTNPARTPPTTKRPGGLDPSPVPLRGRRSLLGQVDVALDRLAQQAAHLDSVRTRIQSIDQQSRVVARPAWQTARTALAADSGLRLAPQFGLVPLGRNRSTSRYEFWHVGSGKRPVFEPARGAISAAGCGLVFVLIPAGVIELGTTDGSALEAPVREVTLAPYFIAKHEMTQGQWQRCFGTTPSAFGPGARPFGQSAPVTAEHPVESIPFADARERLRSIGLTLPTEAQWEHAARGESTSPPGPGSANLLGTPARKHFAVHAPVGSFDPNGFGLYDVRGNVAEWCLDPYGSYRLPVRPIDGCRDLPSSPWRAVRGGSYQDPPSRARVTSRDRRRPDFRDATIGVRPARRVQP